VLALLLLLDVGLSASLQILSERSSEGLYYIAERVV
jgi:hypothetical protein